MIQQPETLFDKETTLVILCKPSKYNPEFYKFSTNGSNEFISLRFSKFIISIKFTLKNILEPKLISKIQRLIQEYQTFAIDLVNGKIIEFNNLEFNDKTMKASIQDILNNTLYGTKVNFTIKQPNKPKINKFDFMADLRNKFYRFKK